MTVLMGNARRLLSLAARQAAEQLEAKRQAAEETKRQAEETQRKTLKAAEREEAVRQAHQAAPGTAKESSTM